MKNIENVIKSSLYRTTVQQRLFQVKCSAPYFAELFLSYAPNKIHFAEKIFIVDEFNKDMINQLYYYLINSNKFRGDLNKGILMIGAIGCGKTVLMEAFIEVFNKVSNKFVRSIGSRDIIEILKSDNLENYYKNLLFIDDIGKEQITTTVYGTVSKPFEDLIYERDRRGSLTFGTANLKLDDMPYSHHINDRMKQDFNILELPGKSRRK